MRTRIGMIMVLVAAVALLAAVACGSSGTAPIPTQPPPTETPVKGDPSPVEPTTVEAPAPIEDTALVAPAAPGGEYILKIISGLPSGCAQFNRYEVELEGNGFEVDVTNLVPGPDDLVACTASYGYHEGKVVLGSGLDSGQAYTVTVNGEPAHSFIAK